MTKLFEELKPFQKAEFLIMLLGAAVIPFSWLAAQYFEAALLFCAVLKIVFEQKFHFNEAQMKWKWVYVVYMLTWVIYLVGMIYTENTSTGWTQVSKKLGFLIFPLIFLFSDMSYLTKKRFRAIGYALVIGCILFFFMNLFHAIYDYIFNDATVNRFFDEGLMKLYYVHHSYLSMYAELGLMFCFLGIFEDNNRKIKIINALAYVVLVFFVILVRSRAGLICLVLMFVLQWNWLTFIIKKKKIGVVMGCVFVIAVIAGCLAFPQSVSRITTTISDVTTEHSSDHRLVQFKGYRQVLKDNWIFGVGTGDRSDAIMASYHEYKDSVVEKISPEMAGVIDRFIDKQYYEPSDNMRNSVREEAEKRGYDPDLVNSYYVDYLFINYAIDKEINAHNMFFETIISVGIVGLLLVLAYFIIPLVLWIKLKKFDVLFFSFLMMIAFNAMFESVFEVQMGIIFFCFFNSLLFWNNFIAENQLNTDK